MARQSQRWKNLERATAEALGGKRVVRGADFSVSDVDVKLDDLPWLKIDCKVRKSHSHHSLLEEVSRKYCKSPEDEPLLVTKHHNQSGAYVTMSLKLFGRMVEAYRKMRHASEM
jgi:hypothetical protein